MSTLQTLISYQRRRSPRNDWSLKSGQQQLLGGISIWVVARDGRMAGKKGLGSDANIRLRLQRFRPLGSKVRVFTWLTRPCDASFFPLNEMSRAPTLPVLITT